MATPCALVASCTSYQPKEIIKEIVGGDLPGGTHVLEQIESYPWHIDTKYYTADVRLCTTETRTFGDEDFAASVHGFILYFNTNDEGSFGQVQSWLPFLKEMEPQVQLLVCRNATANHVVPRQRVLTWCLENGFELVEMEPEEDSDDEVDDDFQETTGIKRVIQALHANPWPNLVMKERPAFRSQLIERMMAEEAQEQRSSADATETNDQSAVTETNNQSTDTESTEARTNDQSGVSTTDIQLDITRLAINDSITDKSQKDLLNLEKQQMSMQQGSSELEEGACGGSSATAPESQLNPDATQSKLNKKRQNEETKLNSFANDLGLTNSDDMDLFNALAADGDDTEDFEKLFDRMREMKEKAESLPEDQRKAYAEQVALAFWSAIGGDPEETEGLFDDEDD